MTVFGDKAFKWVMKIRLGCGWALVQWDWCAVEEIRAQTHTQRRPCEDTGKRQLSTSQGERPQKKPTLLTPQSWTFSLQNWEIINVYCLKDPNMMAGFLGKYRISHRIRRTDKRAKDSSNNLLLFSVFIYLFGCNWSLLWHVGS